MEFGERSYPLGVTLDRQVSARIQKYGACHIFAATAAVEAACYRRTAKVLPISEGYMFGQHLRAEIEIPKSYPFLTIDFTSLFSNNDAGHYSSTLNRVRRGDVRLDSEYSMKDLAETLVRSIKTRAEFWKFPSAEQDSQREFYEARMRSELAADLDQSFLRKTSGALTADVVACSPSTLRTKYVTLTPERIVRLINAAFPVICQFHDSPPSTSSHVYVLIGYRENNAFPDKLELMARDSGSPDVVRYGRNLNCYESAVFYGDEEQARLDDALSI